MPLEICRERQRILDENRHLLVTGGPGSGKTTIALLKAQRRIEEGLCPGQLVLFLSFSRAAVGRVIEASQRKEFPKAIANRLSIQTFHSFFGEIIQSYALLGAPRRLRLLLPHDEAAAQNEHKGLGLDWAFLRSFVKRIEVDKGLATVHYKLPLPPDGRTAEPLPVLPTVTSGGAGRTAGETTAFKMAFGLAVISVAHLCLGRSIL